MGNVIEQAKDIVVGHYNEVVGNNQSLSEKRLAICKVCPLFRDVVGGVCNPGLYYNPTTKEVSPTKKEGFKSGCGCRLNAKTTLPGASCPTGQW